MPAYSFVFFLNFVQNIMQECLNANSKEKVEIIFCILTSVLSFQVGLLPREYVCESYFHRRFCVQVVFLPSLFEMTIPQLDGRISVCKCSWKGAPQRFVHNRCAAQSTGTDNLRTSLSIS